MKTKLATCVCGSLLVVVVVTSEAQTTWNYVISDAGGGNSLVSWLVIGSLATPPGALRLTPDPGLAVSVKAPGIFRDGYAGSVAPQAIPAADGSYFQYGSSSVYVPILSYDAYHSPNGGDDSFGLLALLPGRGGAGLTFLYHPGTQSAFLPIEFSDFNPGTYQSEQSGFATPVTVNLTVGPVPEPSTLSLFAVGGLSGWLLLRRPS